MLFDKLFDRLGRKGKAEQPDPPVAQETIPANGDGWVELLNGRLVAHDPVGNGKFATLVGEGGVRVWINGLETDGLSVVSAADEIRCETDPNEFFRVTLAEDAMAATLILTADPNRIPDSVSVDGQQPAQIRPGYSPHARKRPGAPREIILAELRRLGVQFGVDEAAIDQELAHPTYRPALAARGQEAQPADPGEWIWKLDGVAMVEPGQVIALHQGGHPGKARITVTGESTQVYQGTGDTGGIAPGQGTRLLAGGRLVAAASGRARTVQDGDAKRVDIFPVQLIAGDLTGELSAAGDVIVQGNIRTARVSTTGEVVVGGSVERSEITATGIIVRGGVALSKLHTLQPGSYAPLRGELAFLQRRVEELGDSASVAIQVKEAWFKEAGSFVRALWRKADELQVADPAFKVAMNDLVSLVARSESATSFNRTTAQSLSLRLNVVLGEAARAAATGDIRAKSLAQTQIWAGRDVYVEENFVGCSIFSGGSVETPPTATCSQSEIVAGGEVKLGVLATLRGATPVVVRARRVEAAEVQTGCAFEFGFEHKEIGAEMFRVTCGVNNRGFLVIKQG
ncbi:MAG TPA: flagellar assembly protein A [Symbiobacteriaceae bacterium]|nr:flagellar assembly protein A [Symbiobacteriaceae bacterium]